MQFVMLTDTHFVAQGRCLYGLDLEGRLKTAVEIINRKHPKIAFLIITGDLVHWGEEAAYRNLADALRGCSAPVILMMGNHDRRAPFLAVFPHADQDGAGFVQCVRQLDDATIITLDSLDEEAPNDEGLLCRHRLTFLEQALTAAPKDKPVLLFQHHPPFDTGLKSMDRIKLRNWEDEWAVISRTRRPDYLFTGHVHRPIAGSWNGVPFHIQRGLGHQVAFDFETTDHTPGSHEPPDYTLVTVKDATIVIHQSSFLYDGPRFSLDDSMAAAAPSPDQLPR